MNRPCSLAVGPLPIRPRGRHVLNIITNVITNVIVIAAVAACGRVGYESVAAGSHPDGPIADATASGDGPTSCENLALDRDVTPIGESFAGNPPRGVVDGQVANYDGYWACHDDCSLIIDLAQLARIGAIEVWPGGNDLPSQFYLQRSWRVQFAEDPPNAWRDFEQVEKLAGAGTLGEGLLIENGWHPDHPDDLSARHPEYEHYQFRFAPVVASFIRFDSLLGDIDGDTNLDELAVHGCPAL